METKYYIVARIDGDYAWLNRTDAEEEPLFIARALLPEAIDEGTFSSLGTRGSRRGADGMKTKLRAAHRATTSGIETHIINGKDPEALYHVIRGEPAGTRFIAKQPSETGEQRKTGRNDP